MTMSVKKNYLYNLLYQMTSVLLPVLTIPYVSLLFSQKSVIHYIVNCETLGRLYFFVQLYIS